ncbi:MAG: hypothetical protein HQM02_00135 [Magnetococcales bacterium]|nr:hypothetical protein [Magnetococcales bacterium]
MSHNLTLLEALILSGLMLVVVHYLKSRFLRTRDSHCRHSGCQCHGNTRDDDASG